ncbi:hypothetical protein [Bradyrhizobium sp. AUGA SZCCT0283]|uniref:hypothetical protein n=1 Tax=Bradyrhizobium sp. AUGA SZCCT0283 TaxID=2807671 RepID=UPI002013ACAD|nr:hypothetical protein [Bradyrhizobium sp. AUGA SZCCT0283]
MKQASLGKAAIAVSVFACATMLSFDWTEQKGVSLSVESAQARVGRPLTPVSVAGVARRQGRRAAIGAAAVGAGVVGAGVAAAGYYGATAPYYGGGGPYAYYGGQDYATRNGFVCQPGTLVRMDDGLMHRCQ